MTYVYRPAPANVSSSPQNNPPAFTRIIEVRSPRMNGQDIIFLQNRLLSLGFSGIGSADGLYGPLTEGVVKRIQSFLGRESNGKVDRILWDYIFDSRNTTSLQSINQR